MLTCKEVSKLVSESLDRKLSMWQRFSLWMHIGMCGLCRRFRKDLRHIRDETRQHADDIGPKTAASDANLSDESRDRMKRLLEQDS